MSVGRRAWRAAAPIRTATPRAALALLVPLFATRALVSCSDEQAPGKDGEPGAGGSAAAAGGGPASGGANAGGSAGSTAGGNGGAAGAGGSARGGADSGAGGHTAAPDATASTSDDTCADPRRKRCGGFCVTPRPAVGCGLTGCAPCPTVPFAEVACDGDKCSLTCDDGTTPGASGCAPVEGGVTATCSDGVRDGTETDQDCGGSCPPCALGKHCAAAADCETMQCDTASTTCTCTKLTCADVTGTCGTISDNCGGQLNCAGSCGTGSVCFKGRCCTPRTLAECGAGACGPMDDGCGGTVDCGGCTPPDVCGLVVVNQCSSSGTGCGTDTDFDGLDDCTEDGDGDPYTDKNVFNGMAARLSDGCALINDCNLVRIDTSARADSCVSSKSAIETRNEFSGWDFTTTDTQSCDPGYGFQPTWTTCRTRFAVEGRARMNIVADGTYCFAVDGETKGQCASFFFDGESTALEPGNSSSRCYTVTAGEHTVRFLYTVGTGAGNRRFRLLFCQGAGCTPTAALPSSMLRLP